GPSAFCSLTLAGCLCPGEVLSHLCVLLSIFDGAPGAMSDAAAAELWSEGEAWLETHPERELLERFFRRHGAGSSRHGERHDAVLRALKECAPRRVLDLGCGQGTLFDRLVDDPELDEVVGVEVALDELARAEARLPAGGRGRLLHGSLAYRDTRLAGFDAAALVEVIEHLEPRQLAALEGAVWETARPATVVVTTPNAEYNALFDPPTRRRHPDHRFEWTRAEFREWAEGVAARHGYAARYGPVGPEDARLGPLTQMAVFERLAEPPAPAAPDSPRRADAGIHLDQVAGERPISTRLAGPVRVSARGAAAALESMSRFGADPGWLVCLPPDAPAPDASETAPEDPRAALAFYRARGVETVVLQELHAGTPVVAVVCRHAEAARRRFPAAAGGTGAVYSAAARPFFATPAAEEAFLQRLRDALEAGGAWERLGSEWVALEGVIGPEAAVVHDMNPRLGPQKALHAGLASAALATLAAAQAALEDAASAGAGTAALLGRTRLRAASAAAYSAACRPFRGVVRRQADLRFTPVRVLASQGAVHAERDPRWHGELLAAACHAAPHTLLAAEQSVAGLLDPAGERDARAWWEAALARGSAGVLVRPVEAPADGAHAPLPPAIQCRSADVRALERGPEPRSGGSRFEEDAERAAREWALAVEALERFTRGEPVAAVHQCVFGALALKLGARR
ncbi:MAG TPA: methyltransferase domain-containing protein, partial [Longimicrobium sp.]|nr:methyltransferase domain-containing protein [Longimicrobium sp.]